MHGCSVEQPAPADWRTGERLSWLSIAWNVAGCGAGVAIGVARDSLVLIAFGLTGLLDAVGSAALVTHFRHAVRHSALSERRERLVLRIVILGLFLVAASTVAASIRRLASRSPARSVPSGIALAAASLVVLGVLSSRKRRAGRAIPSRALVADGWVSAVGALLAAVTLMGTVATTTFGWWWLDPLAASAVGAGAVAGGVLLARDGTAA